MKIFKRTFEAKKHPVGGDERKRLNQSAITSEYMTSHKYQLIGDHFSFGYRSKAEAEDAMKRFTH